nr:hypothetical protein [Tanacetum cinerariifolium]
MALVLIAKTFRGVGHYSKNYTTRPRKRDTAYLHTQLLIAQRRKQGYNSRLRNGTHIDNAPIYNSDGPAEYIKLLESTTDTYMVQRYDNNVIPMDSNMDLSGAQVEQHHDTIKETRAFYESLYNNLVIEVEIVNTVNHETREANVKLTAEHTRYKVQEKHFEFNQEQFEELKSGYKKISSKPDSFYHNEHKMALGYQYPFYLKQAQKKQHSLYNGKVLLDKHDPPAVYDS